MPKPKYFEHFPEKTVEYSGIKHIIKDLNRYIRLSPDVILSKYAYYDYVIPGDYRPDHVSYEVYGDSKWYWVILIVNNIRDIWREWPMSKDEFYKYLTHVYGSVSNARSCIHHYITNNGIIIDETTAYSMNSEDYTTVSCYEYEENINEEKRSIKIIQQRYLSDFQEEIKELFEG